MSHIILFLMIILQKQFGSQLSFPMRFSTCSPLIRNFLTNNPRSFFFTPHWIYKEFKKHNKKIIWPKKGWFYHKGLREALVSRFGHMVKIGQYWGWYIFGKLRSCTFRKKSLKKSLIGNLHFSTSWYWIMNILNILGYKILWVQFLSDI